MLSLPVVQPSENCEVPLYTGDMEEDLRRVSRDRLAERVTGGLSWPSKMPCPAWGISATRCRLGSRLAKQPGTTCKDCYALSGHYRFAAVQAKLEQRYEGLFNSLWTPAMVFLVRYFCGEYFRLFDTGDLQGENHYRNILTLARNVPDVQIWMPSREVETIRSVHREMIRQAVSFPGNLLVQVSATKIGGKPPRGFAHTSTVYEGEPPEGFICPAPKQKNSCGRCRACWDPATPNVAYPLHGHGSRGTARREE